MSGVGVLRIDVRWVVVSWDGSMSNRAFKLSSKVS